MESCNNTEKDVDKLLAKFDAFKKDSFKKLFDLSDELEKLHEEISNVGNEAIISQPHQVCITQCHKKLKVSSQKLSSQHKELHSSVSRIGKTIDRNFDAECNCISLPEILFDQNQQKQLNTAICEHFFREGSLSVAKSLAKECMLDFSEQWQEPYLEMKEIILSLKNKNVEPALKWANKHSEQLNKIHSDFLFKLHRLKFLQLLETGPSCQADALQYAKKFQAFGLTHSQEIQQLMGCFLYLKQGLLKSPYAQLFAEDMWHDIQVSFSHQACRIIGIAINCPLEETYNAGCLVLPALVTLKTVIEQRQCSGLLTNTDELPIDIDADNSHNYHSVIACPILRQQTTSKNPPMRLICGHVISKDALDKLVSGSKLKCPYCPVEQSPQDAKELFY